MGDLQGRKSSNSFRNYKVLRKALRHMPGLGKGVLVLGTCRVVEVARKVMGTSKQAQDRS
jgi:hypothetical protein